jgi:HAD superfamily hydrolase (TIGR01549 family)
VTVFRKSDWASIDLVVFDLDGTLYDQRPVRFRMAVDLLIHGVRTRSLRHMHILREYRRIREALGDIQPEHFAEPLMAQVCSRTGASREQVTALVEEWMEQRPLPRLRGARSRGIATLFAALRASGRAIGVWSDYPAIAKLDALGLMADHVRAATDSDLGHLKPAPAGLRSIMDAAGASPQRTLMIGDRAERDGEAARRAGVRALLKTRHHISEHATFRNYDDPVFGPLLSS